MTEKPITDDSGIIKLFESIKRVLKSEQYIIELHQLESNLPKILQAQQEYPKLRRENLLQRGILDNQEKEINQLKQLKQRVELYINDIECGNINLEVACCEGETCTVTEQTKDILQELLKNDKQFFQIKNAAECSKVKDNTK